MARARYTFAYNPVQVTPGVLCAPALTCQASTKVTTTSGWRLNLRAAGTHLIDNAKKMTSSQTMRARRQWVPPEQASEHDLPRLECLTRLQPEVAAPALLKGSATGASPSFARSKCTAGRPPQSTAPSVEATQRATPRGPLSHAECSDTFLPDCTTRSFKSCFARSRPMCLRFHPQSRDCCAG